MKRVLHIILSIFILLNIGISQSNNHSKDSDYEKFNFEGNVNSINYQFEGEGYRFVDGIDGQSLSMQPDNNNLILNDLLIDGTKDFTIQFWIQTSSNKPAVILSQKQFLDKSISSQKNKGWVLYTSGGTFAWSIGSGDRRLHYERENGDKMPLCDGEWHQITMTYKDKLSEVSLYYDGNNKAIYKVGFDFSNDNPLIIGTQKQTIYYYDTIFPQIENGALQLQALIDGFNTLGIGNLKNEEFLNLIVSPDELISRKRKELGSIQSSLVEPIEIDRVKELRKELLKNPYTVFQNLELTKLKPISKIYYLDNGKIIIHKEVSRLFTQQTHLFPSEFNIDNLIIWKKALCAEEVLESYSEFRTPARFNFKKNIKSLIVGDWNIWHGGKHFTIKDNHWDSRRRIVEVIKEKELDVILLQETYSSGEYIAAELGYYYATTSDWDYCFQGSNISIISRYPIKELFVPLDASFMNVGVKLAISETQEIYTMSNWYGMNSFPIVYDFYKEKFSNADEIPVVFGGDFNAVPHTDGGESLASVKMLENGFKDAYRSLHPDIIMFPGYTHQWGERIDQIYYKGQGLKNVSTEVIYTAFGGFPSDHFMILSKFELKY